MPRVLITGGTGGLGSELAPRFAAAGYTVRILSRRPRSSKADAAYEWAQSDLVAGTGLAEAVAGCDLVVHCATKAPSGKGDADGTRNLCAAAKDAGGVPVFYISIVGIDGHPFCPYARPPLTTFEYDIQAMMRGLISAVIGVVTGEPDGVALRQVHVSRLVERQSCRRIDPS